MSDSSGASRRIYRTRGALATGVTIAALVTVAWLIDAALFNTQTKTWVGGGIVAALTWSTLLYTRRVGVHVESDGVRVVNPLRSYRLRWDEIERFELARPAVGVYPLAGFVNLRSGRVIPIVGITVPRFFTRRLKPRAQAPIDELNVLLRSANHPGPASAQSRVSS